MKAWRHSDQTQGYPSTTLQGSCYQEWALDRQLLFWTSLSGAIYSNKALGTLDKIRGFKKRVFLKQYTERAWHFELRRLHSWQTSCRDAQYKSYLANRNHHPHMYMYHHIQDCAMVHKHTHIHTVSTICSKHTYMHATYTFTHHIIASRPIFGCTRPCISCHPLATILLVHGPLSLSTTSNLPIKTFVAR